MTDERTQPEGMNDLAAEIGRLLADLQPGEPATPGDGSSASDAAELDPAADLDPALGEALSIGALDASIAELLGSVGRESDAPEDAGAPSAADQPVAKAAANLAPGQEEPRVEPGPPKAATPEPAAPEPGSLSVDEISASISELLLHKPGEAPEPVAAEAETPDPTGTLDEPEASEPEESEGADLPPEPVAAEPTLSTDDALDESLAALAAELLQDDGSTAEAPPAPAARPRPPREPKPKPAPEPVAEVEPEATEPEPTEPEAAEPEAIEAEPEPVAEVEPAEPVRTAPKAPAARGEPKPAGAAKTRAKALAMTGAHAAARGATIAGQRAAPAGAALLVAVNRPVANRSKILRDSIGWVALWTLFMGVCAWGFVLMRHPRAPEVQTAPVDLMNAASPPADPAPKPVSTPAPAADE